MLPIEEIISRAFVVFSAYNGGKGVWWVCFVRNATEFI